MTRRFPFPESPDVWPPDEYRELLAQPGLPEVLLSNGHRALLVTRYADVKAVLSDDRFSRAAFGGTPMFARTTESLALATSDPPVHTRRRAAVTSAFSARKARQLMPRLRELADQLIDGIGEPPVDLVESFTVPFALRASTELLGIPAADEPRLRPLVDAMMSTTRFTRDHVTAAHREAAAYFDELVATKQAHIAAGRPRPDLLTELLTAERLSHKEIAVFGAGLLMAGYETTSNQLAMCALMVFGDPDRADRLRLEPAGVEPAVEEMLRWSSLIATGGAPHVATEDARLGDTVVRAGQVVVPLTAAANRDATVFAEPECLRPDRADNPHVAFGHGRHHCLGAELARVELRVGLRALLDRFHELTVDAPVSEIPWRSGMFIRGPAVLPVSWTGACDEA
ncbi:MAG TPA: cytochrome P450 [Pseudonocardiaceae bacterium]|nr:cytochrome P450 [Pseudonocardiaceae bacterium]